MKKTETKSKELSAMLDKIKDAQKHKLKQVVVFTTNRSNHKKNVTENGFGVNDLLPKFSEAYKHLFCAYDVDTRMIGAFEVEWIVKL